MREGIREAGRFPVQGGPEALCWTLGAGLVLRARHRPGWMAPEAVGRRLGEPVFSVQEVDRATTDLLVYRN